MGGEPVCVLTDIEKTYVSGGQPALGPLSLTVRQGEILGLRGRNGAGKSTLMAIMAGTLRPSGGKLEYGAGVRGGIGYVPQELSLYGSLTGLENLRFWGLAAGLPSRYIKKRSAWLLDRFQLSDKARARVDSYSGGMKRRLHLASALMVTPRLLLMDEPTVGADSSSAELILSMAAHVSSLGCAVVMISHQTGELERLCHRILTLEAGLPAGWEELR